MLFTFVEAGMGHIIPMNGIYGAFLKKYGDRCQAVKSYVFSSSPSEEVRAMAKALAAHTKRVANDNFYNFIEAVSYGFSSKTTLKILDARFRKAIEIFSRELKEISPDLIVSSYYMPSHIAAKANRSGLTDTLIATYSPDPYIYPAWARNCDLFIVNNDNAERMALAKGFSERQVKKVPFVYDEKVARPGLSREQARIKAGTDGRFTVLFTNGAYGTKRTGKLLNKIIDADLDINLIAVCGNDGALFDEISRLKENNSGRTRITVTGFTDKLNEFMLASDLSIGKGGSNTIMESVYLGCPMIINAEASRLETETAKYRETQGLVIREKNPDRIVRFIKKCMSDKSVLESYRKNAEPFIRADGAEICADILFELLREKSGGAI